MKIYKDIIEVDPKTHETINTIQTDLGTFVSKANVQKKDEKMKSSFIGADIAVLKNYSKYMKAKARMVEHQLDALKKVLETCNKRQAISKGNEIVEEIIIKKIRAYESLKKKYRKDAKAFRNAAILITKQRRKEVAYLKKVQAKMYKKAQLRKELKEQNGDNDNS